MNGPNSKKATTARNRRQRGFTLIELMITMAILGVLMTIVAPRVAGTKSVSLDSQIKSDGSSIRTAVNSFNNRSTKENQWPDQDLGDVYAYSTSGGSVLLDPSHQLVLLSDGEPVTFDPVNYAELDWDAQTTVWQDDGTTYSATFMPDFLMREPESVNLLNDEDVASASGTKLREILWVLKKTQVGYQDEGRTVEAYRLTGYDSATGAVTYERIF